MQKEAKREAEIIDVSQSTNPDNLQHVHNEPHEHIDDGYVKYNCVWTQSQPLSPDQISALNMWRQKLYELHLVGAYPNKVGFGNVSIRIDGTNNFIVSGTETGNLAKLNESHYSIVTNVDLDTNTLHCNGPCRASSEAMTHAAAYAADPNIMAVIHCHSPTMWKDMLRMNDGKLTTPKSASYGTPQIAHAVSKLLKREKKRPLMIVLGGHETGMFCVGKDIDSVGNEYLKQYKRLKLSPSNT